MVRSQQNRWARSMVNIGLAVCLVQGASALAADEAATRTTYTYALRGALALKADVYSTAQSVYGSNRPALVFVHGGGWTCGNRNAFGDLPRYLAQTYGVVAVTVSYRLAPVTDGTVVDGRIVSPGVQDGCPADNAPTDGLGLPENRQPYPAQLQDLRDLMLQLKHFAPDLQVDATRVAVVGASAGAHLAGLLGATDQGINAAPTVVWPGIDARPAAIVSIAGPWNLGSGGFTDPSVPGMLRNLFNGPPTAAQLAGASPLTYAQAPTFPTTLFIHGAGDTLVPPQQSVEACTAMRACAYGQAHIVNTPAGAHPHDAMTLLQASSAVLIDFLASVLNKPR